MRTGVARWVTTGLLTTSLAFGVSQPAFAHEEGVLQPTTKQWVVGATVQIRGKQFGKHADLALVLVGTRGQIRLRMVRTDSAGGFVADLTIPTGMTAGDYRLVAIAEDGDRVASVEIAVMEAGPLAPLGEDQHAGHDEANMAMPTADPLELVRARSAVMTGAAVLFIVAATLGSGLLLRRPRNVR